MRLFLCCILTVFAWASPHRSFAQTVLVNEQFDGNAVDTSVFTFSGPGDESFFGRTQLNSPGLPGPFDAPPVANGTLRLRAQSFNRFAPGSLFFADEIRTIDQYAPTADTRIVADTRARFVDDATNPLSPGLIGGIFFFGLDANFPNPFERDEIDFELLSNFPQDNILTNIFNDQGFSSAGDAQFLPVPGLDITEFNDYRIESSLDSTRFFINDVLIREQFTNLATEPQDFRLNINVQNFFPAFSPDLQPTANPALNEIFIFEVDSLVITEESTLETFEPADFDQDGDVDADDLATLQAAFGSSAAGDTDDDGDTDGADFLAWQQQFTGAASATANAVPEPGTLSLLLGGALVLLGKRRQSDLRTL